MVTAHATVASAVDAMRHGAFDYIEFVGEFLSIERLIIVHSGIVPEARALRELLSASPRAEAVEEHIYGPAVSALLGPKALGVVVLEGGGA